MIENLSKYFHDNSLKVKLMILHRLNVTARENVVFLPNSGPADHPRSSYLHLRRSAGATSGTIFYLIRQAGAGIWAMYLKQKLCISATRKMAQTLNLMCKDPEETLFYIPATVL